MPQYEYRCDTCTKEFEIICKVAEHEIVARCPNCGGNSRQILSAAAVHGDNPRWLNNNVRTQIQGDDNAATIETRADYDKYCKQNGIIVTN